MRKIWVNKADTFEAAQKFEQDYYFKMGKVKRLETVQLLREGYLKIKRGRKNENREGLRSVIKVIQQK